MTSTATIPLWTLDADQRVQAHRDAEHWRALPYGRRVRCDLCYRKCELGPGEAGWCRIRRNEGGRLVLPEHGVLSTCQELVTHHAFFRQHARAAWFGGVGCTARCSFCTSTRIVHAPDRLDWLDGDHRLSTAHGGWSYYRAMLHPAGVIARAREWGCTDVYSGVSEPLLMAEYVLDVFRLAQDAGLYTRLDSNGFGSPAVIRQIAPVTDFVNVGVKGHGDAGFYERHMRSAGAVPHVLRSAATWQEAGVQLMISDVVPPLHWVAPGRSLDQVHALSAWIARELGPLTPLEVRVPIRPQFPYGDNFLPLLPPHDAGPAGQQAMLEHFLNVEAVARAAGLRYVYSDLHRRVTCHHCDGILLDRIGSPDFDLCVTDGHCDHCGGAVPITAITRDEWQAIQREAAAS